MSQNFFDLSSQIHYSSKLLYLDLDILDLYFFNRYFLLMCFQCFSNHCLAFGQLTSGEQFCRNSKSYMVEPLGLPFLCNSPTAFNTIKTFNISDSIWPVISTNLDYLVFHSFQEFPSSTTYHMKCPPDVGKSRTYPSLPSHSLQISPPPVLLPVKELHSISIICSSSHYDPHVALYCGHRAGMTCPAMLHVGI